ncbi:DUF2231 domain-containing protein [Paractinoplanes rishiriensis]|uniref:DUF2231 domain-containing protein n=1 Tax=Paractinoplanes rishiriensis TaxID=1050105 RepID=A0A919K3U9_9ACTN|nr:DUF2231 domain-containing protein [Actinoplanes rishiriensis]GIE98284.1 hypothetical protein Ari01nite_57490 [Actinoplanes rishiriensis]
MESRLSIAGQAVQPILVMFPLGLFAMAVIFDVADLLGGFSLLGTLGYWNVVAGLVGGTLALLAGAIDLAFVRRPTARRIGVLRILLNMGVLVLFAVILMVRVGDPARGVGVGLFLLEVVAVGVSGFGLWFSGELANGRTPAFAKAAASNRGY